MTDTLNSQARDTYEHEPPIRYTDDVPTSPDPSIGSEVDHTPVKSSRFNADNAQAVPVFERATTSFTYQTVRINQTGVLVGRRRGRKYVAISCPVAWVDPGGVLRTPVGFQVSNDRNNIDTGVGGQLNPGESVEIASEAEIYVGPLPAFSSGFIVVSYVECFNVLGGPASV